MLRVLTMIVLALGALTAAAAPRMTELALVPQPAQVELQRGEFEVGARTPLFVTDDDRAAAVAHYFGDLLFRARGMRTEIVRGPHSRGGRDVIQFTLKTDPAASVESYTLAISSEGVQLTAPSPRGLFYGAITLWQILTQEVEQASSVRIPAVRIVDAPRLQRRGVMLDSTVQFHSVEFVKGFIDALALHKLNVLQWRLAGDAAWRLQLAKRPQLTKTLGAGARTFYTHEDVRDILQHAAARHVAIVPQLDLPAPATIDESAFAFVRDVLEETAALFPGALIYVGVQQPPQDWTSSPQVRARMGELGLADAVDLQRYFNSRVAAMMQERGRMLAGPDSLMIGAPSGGALIVSARGLDSALGAVSAGYDVVVSSPLLDFGQPDAASADQTSGALVSSKTVYSFDPAPAALAATTRARLVGVQANLAAPDVVSEEDLARLAFPRAAALAEAAWSPTVRLGWAGFQQRLPAQMARYRKLGIPYSDGVFRTLILVRDASASNRARVELSKQAALGEIRYTLNGAEPTASSQAYTDLFEVKTPAVVKAATFLEGVALTAPTTLAIGSAATAQR